MQWCEAASLHRSNRTFIQCTKRSAKQPQPQPRPQPISKKPNNRPTKKANPFARCALMRGSQNPATRRTTWNQPLDPPANWFARRYWINPVWHVARRGTRADTAPKTKTKDKNPSCFPEMSHPSSWDSCPPHSSPNMTTSHRWCNNPKKTKNQSMSTTQRAMHLGHWLKSNPNNSTKNHFNHPSNLNNLNNPSNQKQGQWQWRRDSNTHLPKLLQLQPPQSRSNLRTCRRSLSSGGKTKTKRKVKRLSDRRCQTQTQAQNQIKIFYEKQYKAAACNTYVSSQRIHPSF